MKGFLVLDFLYTRKIISIRTVQHNWFDGEVLKAIKTKNDLYKKALRTNNVEDWDALQESKQSVRSLLIRKKRGYVTCKLGEKIFWKDIRENLHFGKQQQSGNGISIYCPESDSVKTGKDVACLLNQY